MVCLWNLGTRPPIRINDIFSWTYDENTFSENPARSEGPWIKSNTDFAIINKLSGWKWWCNEANWSPGVLRCCVLESWLYCKFEHNRSILRDAFGDMLEHMAYFWIQMRDYKIRLYDGNSPLHVELSIFIESHFKCIVMNVKLIFRLGFGVKSQKIRGRRLHGRQ